MRAFVVGIVLIVGVRTWAQCPVADFSVPATACIDQNLLMQNTSSGATSFEWDFCSGDLALTPNTDIAASNSLLFRTRSIRVVKNLNNWYGFTIDQADSPYRLIRFNFGTSLQNTPVISDLGNPSGLLNGSYDLQMYTENGNWYALVANSGANNILKLNFGSNLDATPTIQNMGSFGELKTPNGIFLIQDNGVLAAFVTNETNVGAAQITRLDFGTSINNVPVATSFSINGASTLRGISIIRECDRWFGLVTSYGNGKVFWLDFNNGLGQVPQTGEITFFTSFNFPAGISIINDGSEYFSFVQSAVGPLYRLSFGASIIDKSGTGQDMGNFGISENFATEWVKENSDWYGFSMDLANRQLMRYTFPTMCDATLPVYSGLSPPLNAYALSGARKISVKATNLLGEWSSTSKTITVFSSSSPDITFTSLNICANNNILFASENVSGDIATYNWNFGDANTSSSANPTHQYTASGEYYIQLNVTSNNGCQNFTYDTIKVYYPPIAAFTLPPGSICTGNEFIFVNTTSDDFDGNLSYQWLVNAQPVSTMRDMMYALTLVGSNDITLRTSIPGCTDEVTQTILNVMEGPSPDFSFAGQCEDENITFTNSTSGTVSGYFWNFGDGQNSTNVNSTNIFSNPGAYNVTLTASNVAGCNNTLTKSLTIYSKPQVVFFALAPPFSCNGTSTQFNDLTPNPTDSNLSSWQWNFGDAGSSQNTSSVKNPQHVFDNAGNYDVSLTVFTNFLCSSSLQLPVTISQTPVADFNYSPACEDVPVNFSDVSIGTINSWDWQIGSSFYSIQNPTHTFINSGSTNATLTVTANNNCIGSVSKPIVVPAKLIPDFAVSKNCVTQQTLFTDLTNSTADPVSSYNWNFGGLGTALGTPVNFTFNSIANVNVTLTLTTQTGCVHQVTKPVNILESPQAGFTASPDTGGPPLAVQFTNTSVNATSYLWTFNDGSNSTSTQVSLLFAYQNLGQYQADLTAFNAQNCSHTFSKTIYVLTPVVDVAVSGLELMEFQNGAIKPAVTIFNNGNTQLSNMALLMDVSGSIIRETVGALIMPNSSYRYVFQFELANTNTLDYFCVKAEIDDVNLHDNTTCLSLEKLFTTLAPHPNPSKGVLNVSWIIREDGMVNLTLINSMGQTVQNFRIASQEGLNPFTLNATALNSGVYFLQINYKQFTKVYRVFVSE